MTLDEARDSLGLAVLARSPGWPEEIPTELGVITHVGHLVHVRFAGDQHSKACVASDLTLAAWQGF